jgi:UPF0716 family protein affecting phage T7 exclusion
MHPTRILWLCAAIVVISFSITLGVVYGWPATILLIAVGIAPDLTLIGAQGDRPGLLRPSRVAAYNRAHRPGYALTTLAVGGMLAALPGVADVLAITLTVAGTAWITHIAVDRAVGYGFRDAKGAIVPVGEERPVGVGA